MTKALIVEDNRAMSDSLKMMLQLLDIQARQAFTPRAALATLEEGIPNIVFLDINLPSVDGFEVLGYIRRDPRLATVPVIIVTSEDQPETFQRAKDGGAAAVVIKPATLETIELALRKVGLL